MCSLKITLTLHVQQEPLLPQNVNRLLLNTPEMGNCKRKEKKSFDALDLRYIVIKNCLKTKKELLRFANKQLHEGKTGTTIYILNNTTCTIKIMDTCREMEDATKDEDRESKSRLCSEG